MKWRILVNEFEFKDLFFSADTMVNSNNDLSICLKMALFDSNLDEMRCIKLLDRNADLECRWGSSRIVSTKGLDQEECENVKCVGRHTGGELVTWMKVELQNASQ